MAERNSSFWNEREMALVDHERKWFADSVRSDVTNYTMGGELNQEAEKITGNRLLLAGPLVDGYLKEIGRAIHAKLSRSNVTGLAAPITLFIPGQVMNYMSSLCANYGAEVVIVQPKRKLGGKTVIFIESGDCASKIFNPVRFDGTNFLSKRKFKKVVEPSSSSTKKKQQTTVYDGHVKVPICKNTPIRFQYFKKLSHLTVTFYIQRYDGNDFATDLALQNIINAGNEEQMSND